MPKKNKGKKQKKIVQVIVKPKAQPKKKVTVSTLGKAMREAGSFAGGIFGMPALGKAAGAAISRVFGQGDYIVNHPSNNSLLNSGVPGFSPLTSGFRVKHREYIKDISSSVLFASQSYSINPGLVDLFPWLSTVAQNFEEYRIHGMVIYLNTMSGVGISSTNTALGMWGAVTQYDPSEPDFVTKQQAENYVGVQTSVPSNSLIHGIECKPRSSVLDKMFVRTGPIPDSEDLKFYDWGKTQIFTQGSQSINVIGEMWISYDIEFSKPRLALGGVNQVYSDHYQIAGSTGGNSMFGVNPAPLVGSNLGTTVNGNLITIPAIAPNTKYLLTVTYSDSSAFTSTNIATTVTGSVTLSTVFFGPGVTYLRAPQGGTGAASVGSFNIVFTKSGSSVGTLTLTTCPTLTNASVNIAITQMQPAITAEPVKQKIALDDEELKLLKILLGKARLMEAEELAEMETNPFVRGQDSPERQRAGNNMGGQSTIEFT